MLCIAFFSAVPIMLSHHFILFILFSSHHSYALQHQGEKEEEQVLQVPQQIATLQPMEKTMPDRRDIS